MQSDQGRGSLVPKVGNLSVIIILSWVILVYVWNVYYFNMSLDSLCRSVNYFSMNLGLCVWVIHFLINISS